MATRRDQEMKSKKLTASVMVAVVLLVVGCNGGEECPPVVSGPAPGPIIDIGGKSEGMISLREDGRQKVLTGQTTPDEVLRVTQLDVA